jgi:hypothetical protein
MAETSPKPKTLEELAARVAELASMVTTSLRANGHPEPSFQVDGPESYPAGDRELGIARYELLQHLADMQLLVMGPKDWSFMTGLVVSALESMRFALFLSAIDVEQSI